MSHPFNGTFTVNARLKLLGITVRRQVRVSFGYTPDWPFIDPATGFEAAQSRVLNLTLEILARPGANVMPSGKPAYWTPANELLAPGVLNRQVYEQLNEIVDADAHIEDWIRRDKNYPNLNPGSSS